MNGRKKSSADARVSATKNGALSHLPQNVVRTLEFEIEERMRDWAFAAIHEARDDQWKRYLGDACQALDLFAAYAYPQLLKRAVVEYSDLITQALLASPERTGEVRWQAIVDDALTFVETFALEEFDSHCVTILVRFLQHLADPRPTPIPNPNAAGLETLFSWISDPMVVPPIDIAIWASFNEVTRSGSWRYFAREAAKAAIRLRTCITGLSPNSRISATNRLRTKSEIEELQKAGRSLSRIEAGNELSLKSRMLHNLVKSQKLTGTENGRICVDDKFLIEWNRRHSAKSSQ